MQWDCSITEFVHKHYHWWCLSRSHSWARGGSGVKCTLIRKCRGFGQARSCPIFNPTRREPWKHHRRCHSTETPAHPTLRGMTVVKRRGLLQVTRYRSRPDSLGQLNLMDGLCRTLSASSSLNLWSQFHDIDFVVIKWFLSDVLYMHACWVTGPLLCVLYYVRTLVIPQMFPPQSCCTTFAMHKK